MDLGTAFAFSVLRQPDREAIVDGGRRRTYAHWYSEIRAAAGALRAMGLRPGDHLVVVMRNRYEMATLYWACHLLGVIFTPVSWRATRDEIAYCLEDAEAVAVAYDGAASHAVPEAAARLNIDARHLILAADGQGEGLAFEGARVAFIEPAASEVSQQQLDEVCLRSGLARFKRPREYIFVKSIPRSAAGKILRRRLRSGDYERL